MQTQTVHVTVNGVPQTLDIQAGETLAEMLRNRLGLTSVKAGCEAGECGACNVLIDKKSFNSCIYLAAWTEGKNILTVEGLQSENGDLSDIQRIFIEEAAVQCGFCTPGIILTAVELVGHQKPYSREQLRTLISGHLCRCTGYENILNALEKCIAISEVAGRGVV